MRRRGARSPSAHRSCQHTPAGHLRHAAELNAATAGETIELDNAGVPRTAPAITYPVTLPSVSITLEGATPQDGFNGQGTAQLMTGTNVQNTTITNLTFEKGSTTGAGGAIAINGSSNADPTLSNDTVYGNTASGGAGAVYIHGSGGTVTVTHDTFGGASSGEANTSTATVAGALEVEGDSAVVISNDTFTDNTSAGGSDGYGSAGAVFAASTSTSGDVTFTYNTLTGNAETNAGGLGGGATLQGNTIEVSNNTFGENSIAAGTGDFIGSLGGGLDVVSYSSSGTVTESHNVFDDNTVGAFDLSCDCSGSYYFGGGGEYVQAASVTSYDDTFTGNTVGIGSDSAEGAGGGIGIQGLDSADKSTRTATNLVATNNSVGGDDGYGGGIYAGYESGCGDTVCPAEVDLYDSTLDANRAPYGAGASGGAAPDVGKFFNDIVYGNTGSSGQLNYASGNFTVQYTDSCDGTNAAYTGAGNVCVDPSLVNPVSNDIDETSSSPTIDAGSNALVPSGVTYDYKGDARIADGTVDMGADEYVPAGATPTPVTPPVPSTGAAPSSSSLPLGGVLAALGLVAVAALLTLRGTRRRGER